MAKAPEEGPRNSSENIDQIRDIILGPQKRDYDQRFEKMAADLHRFQEDTRKSIERLGETIQAELTASQRSLEEHLREQAAGFQKQSASLRDDLNTARTNLQNELKAVKEQISGELANRLNALNDAKVSRDALAELLQELSIKLKGVEVFDELRKAARKKQGD